MGSQWINIAGKHLVTCETQFSYFWNYPPWYMSFFISGTNARTTSPIVQAVWGWGLSQNTEEEGK